MLRELVIYNTKDAASQQALGTLKEIAIDLDQVPQFTAWLKQHNIASFSANELESLTLGDILSLSVRLEHLLYDIFKVG